MKSGFRFVTILLVNACLAFAGGELSFALPYEPKTLEPNTASDDASEIVQYLTGGVLIRVHRETQELQPELAVSWKLARDGSSIQFRLREGVRFSDGTPFGAEDVIHTWRQLMDPKRLSPVADSFDTGGGETRATASGSHDLTIVFPKTIAGVERLFDQVVIVSARSPKAVLGPFRIADHRPGALLLLERNPHYWKKDSQGRQLPYLDRVRLEIQSNSEIELMRFQRGQYSLMNLIQPSHFDRLSRHPRIEARDAGASLDMEMLWFNQVAGAPIPAERKRWFRLQAFRRAVAEAIHREDLCRVVYGGHAVPGLGPVSPANRFWRHAGLTPHSYSPASALARLEKEGFRRHGERLLDPGGKPVEFSIITNADNRARQRMAAMIQEDLKKIGVQVHVVTLDFPSLLERITRSFDYDACLLGFTNVDLDPNAQMNVWLSSAGQHPWNPAQPKPATEWEAEIDRHMRAQASTANREERKRRFDRIQEIVWEQAPIIYLVHKNVLVGYSKALRNVRVSALRPHLYWNVEHLAWGRP